MNAEPWASPDYTRVWHGAVHKECAARIAALERQIKGGHCLECGLDRKNCEAVWKAQRKCCPECTHV
jgi:hypothetical protein